MLNIIDALFYSTMTESVIYEVPPEKYSAEIIIRILLDPKIDKSRVCKERPITTAARQWYVGVTANQDGGYQCVRNELSHVSLLLYISTAI